MPSRKSFRACRLTISQMSKTQKNKATSYHLGMRGSLLQATMQGC